MNDSALHWFRRDLRLADNKALSAALQESARVHCVFVFDTDILGKLTRRADRRVEFILHCVAELADDLAGLGGNLIVLHGRAVEEIPRLARRLQAGSVYTNRDYEPAAIARDQEVERALNADGMAFYRCKDQVVFEQDELVSQEGRAYTVFAAYRNAWLKRLPQADLEPAPLETARGRFARWDDGTPPRPLPRLQDLGFETTNLLELGIKPGTTGADQTLGDFLPRMHAYREARDYPAVRGVSYLSVHLRFGTVSVRRLVNEALRDGSEGARTWLAELIWRDFYFSILYLFPHVVGHAFRRDLEALPFTNREDRFDAWREGHTGYPLVDAAMRQLNRTGYMHNRLRMLTASFLVKHLQVDWRWGERYFAEQLNDYDLAANNGGWQWSASTGNDAQPWFRIFNPVLQSKRFDAEGRFIRRYVPELAGCSDKLVHEPWKMSPAEQAAARVLIGEHYPAPVVDHAQARQAALRMFQGIRPAAGSA
ncbi:MAG: deoxyribodipyrimidine photo-lyase [Lautropia sp.]|nr:deoxyribodipyrimidine photo-lyase [Lautropia sp.]